MEGSTGIPQFSNLRAVYDYMKIKDTQNQGFIAKGQATTEKDKNLFKAADRNYWIFGGDDKLTPVEIIESQRAQLGLSEDDMAHIKRTTELIEMLRSDDRSVQMEAVDILGREGRFAIDTVIFALNDRSAYVREVAVRTLGKIDTQKSRDMLVSIFHAPNNPLREEAMRALVEVKKDERTLRVLIEACKSPEKNIRLHALRALANSKSYLIDKPLRAATQDPDEDIQDAANRSLANIQKLSPGERRKRHEEEQEEPQNDPHKAAGFYPNYVDSLAESIKNMAPSQEPLPPKTPKTLEQAWIMDLKSSNPESRIVAARGLGYTKKNKAAAQALIQAIKDPEPQVRIAVAEALGKIGYRKSIEVLKQATTDPDEGVRFMAKRSLKKFE